MLLWLITLRVQFISRLKQFRVGVSRTGSLFLAPEESVEGNIGHLADLESDSGNVSHGVTLTTKSRDQNLVVLLDEVEATVVGDEGGDLLAVLDELDSHALTDGRVGLLSLNTNLLQDNSLQSQTFKCCHRSYNNRCNIPWRGKLLRRDWPSILFPNEPSCSPCRPRPGSSCSSRVS